VQKKKRVLLVDGSPVKRDLRAETMRKLGMNVDCAADISEARSWWRADLYNLVLINVGNDLGNCDKFCEDMRNAEPKQQLGFLVGKPEYIANEPMEAETAPDSSNGKSAGQTESSAPVSSVLPGEVSQRWGIMEASRRISEVRSAAHARTRAIRERPAPPRDSEMRLSKGRTEARTLDDLLREETL
jgi:CheY-like chemotaxis protein